jgi:hypothetical protein
LVSLAVNGIVASWSGSAGSVSTFTVTAATTFTISGKIATSNGTGIAGITVNPPQNSVVTDSYGYYSMTVAANANYILVRIRPANPSSPA